MKHLSASEIKSLHSSLDVSVYEKYGRVLVRNAEAGETIITMIDGRIETIKVSSATDVVIKNITIDSSGETYIIGWDKFQDRYDVNDSSPWKLDGQYWKPATPTGKVIGGFWGDPSVTFDAPWGEKMILKRGDFLATPYPVDDPDDIYRIAAKEFHQTYKKEEHHGN